MNLNLDTPMLWKSLDLDSDGKLSLEELCPDFALALARFRQWACSSFGSCVDVWDSQELARARTASHQHGSWFSDKKMMTRVFADSLKAIGWLGRQQERALLTSGFDMHSCGCIS